MCNTINETTNRFCKLCGTALREEDKTMIIAEQTNMNKINEIMNLLTKYKDVLSILAQKIKELEA